MPEHVKEIAERLKAMRDISGCTVADMADKLGIPASEYEKMESGAVDIPISVLCEAADVFGISVTEFLTGDRAKLRMYSVVRKNKGIGAERTAAYSYASLAWLCRAARRAAAGDRRAQTRGHAASSQLHADEFHYCRRPYDAAYRRREVEGETTRSISTKISPRHVGLEGQTGQTHRGCHQVNAGLNETSLHNDNRRFCTGFSSYEDFCANYA